MARKEMDYIDNMRKQRQIMARKYEHPTIMV